MKNYILIIIACLMLTGMFSCEKSDDKEGTNEIFLNQKAEKLVKADNEFGFQLFKNIDIEPGKNLCISPLSISMALGMTYNGANTQTKEAMKVTLGLAGLSPDDINRSYKDLINALITNDSAVIFELANSIWSRLGFPVEQKFINLNQEYFNALVREIDFSAEATINVINQWVSDNTHNKIESILDSIPAQAVMYLINAIYFKGIWKYEFDEKETFESIFSLANGEDILLPYMKQEGTFNYMHNDLFTSVELPYGTGNFSMHFLLPNEDIKIADIIEAMDEESWNNWLSQYQETEDVTVNIPKFKFSYKKSLNDELKEMGMEIAFSSNADFTGINKGGNLLISDVKHKTFIEVNEEGTEAAAVTSVEIRLTSISGNYFMANKPFIFIIKEKTSNAILFIGKVENPVLE